MSRWMIEKDGTGIEKSGTGIEKSGTGIEKSGTGIEKSGTGIEKSGTGIRRGLLACSMAAIVFASNLYAGNIDPAGSLQMVVQNDKVAVSWIIGDSVFSGVSSLNGSFARMMLTEISFAYLETGTEVDDSSSGTDIVGTGSGIDVIGTGSGIDIVGTGSGIDAVGSDLEFQLLVAGSETDVITITLPQGTGMTMEVSMGCGFATVAVVDSNSVQVVTFDKVSVIGKPEFCRKRLSQKS